jgi:predicted RNA binding protein YcfA (HicA-like mRNA interferase family)
MGFTMTAAEVIAFLVAHGYHKEGGGKHLKMVKGGHRVPIPKHPGDMPKGTVNSILDNVNPQRNYMRIVLNIGHNLYLG